MNEEIAGKLMAFKGDYEYIPDTNVLVEITEMSSDGNIEIAFDAPIPGNPRVYLKISLPEMIQSAMNIHLPKE